MAHGRWRPARKELELLRGFAAEAPMVRAVADVADAGEPAAALVAWAMTDDAMLAGAVDSEDVGRLIAWRSAWGL